MTDRPAPPLAPVSPALVVAAALVDGEGRVLVQRRPLHKQHGGLWEFPGGKVEAGEAPGEAIARELAEELGIAVDAADAAPAAFACPVADGASLVLLLFMIRRWLGEPRALEASAFAWHPPAAIADLPTPPGDRELAVALTRLMAADHPSLFD